MSLVRMADTTSEPEASTSSGTESDSETTSGDESSLGRRELLVGGGVIGALALGGTGMLLSQSPSAEESSFILQQGYLRYEVDGISEGELNVEEFYDYTNTSANPAGDVIEEDAASRLFVYDGPVDSSLVFLHGSPDGGSAFFTLSGLSRSNGEWAVRDDPRSVSDDFEPWDGGNARVEWQWGEQTTDGGAFWGGLDRSDFTVTVNPKRLSGVDSWRFLSGELGDLERYDLYREKPVTLKPTKGRTIKKANVDIMPGSGDNEFDPYSTELLTVAVTVPPEDADDSEWVSPDDLDPGNYSVNFGSKAYLAGQNAAQPQRYSREDGTLYLEYKAKAANFSLDSAYGYLVSKVDDKTYVRGRDVVRPGGFDNVDTERAELVVTDRNVDPEGDDSDRLADEYVTFENDGDETLDLTGYTVRDEAGATYDLPDGFSLDAGARVRLHTGAGENGPTDLYWDAGTPVWNNDGDTVIVLDKTGFAVLEYSYPEQ